LLCSLVALAPVSVSSSNTLLYATQDLVSTSAAQPWSCLCVQITYSSNFNTTLTSILYSSFYDSLGQSVYVATATITVSPGHSTTALLVALNLPNGNYEAKTFATTAGGVPISVLTILNVSS